MISFSHFRFHFANHKWTEVTPMSFPRRFTAHVVLSDRLYVIGGYDDKNMVLNLVESYNPLIDKWKTLMPMRYKRYTPAACVSNGFIYVLGGLDNAENPIRSIERYEPRENTWTEVSWMSSALFSAGIKVLMKNNFFFPFLVGISPPSAQISVLLCCRRSWMCLSGRRNWNWKGSERCCDFRESQSSHWWRNCIEGAPPPMQWLSSSKILTTLLMELYLRGICCAFNDSNQLFKELFQISLVSINKQNRRWNQKVVSILNVDL